MTRTAPISAFKTLGVTPEDDFATIRRAWCRLVKANHPDVSGCGSEEGTRRLAELNNAYDALRWHNPEKMRILEKQNAARARVKRRAKPASKSAKPAAARTGNETELAGEKQRDARACRDSVRHEAQQFYIRRETLWALFGAARAQERFRSAQRLCTEAAQSAPKRLLRRACPDQSNR